MASFFDEKKNPYKRWGIKTGVAIGEMSKVPKGRTSYIKITMKNKIAFFGGFDENDDVIFVDLNDAISAGQKQCSKIRKKLGVNNASVVIVTTTRR